MATRHRSFATANGARASTHVDADAAQLSDTAWRPRALRPRVVATPPPALRRRRSRWRTLPKFTASRVARGAPPTATTGPLVQRRAALVAAIDAALTKEARKADALRKEAKAAADAEAMAHRANLIFSNLYRIEDGATQISVEDWENGGEVVEITFSEIPVGEG